MTVCNNIIPMSQNTACGGKECQGPAECSVDSSDNVVVLSAPGDQNTHADVSDHYKKVMASGRALPQRQACVLSNEPYVHDNCRVARETVECRPPACGEGGCFVAGGPVQFVSAAGEPEHCTVDHENVHSVSHVCENNCGGGCCKCHANECGCLRGRGQSMAAPAKGNAQLFEGEVGSDVMSNNTRDSGECAGSGVPGTGVTWRGTGAESASDPLRVEQTADGRLRVTVSEQLSGPEYTFMVGRECVDGRCMCDHLIGGVVSQLKPCRFFAESYFRGDCDPDSLYIMRGIVFGFMVIDPTFEYSYDSCRRKARSEWESNIIERKLRAEIQQGILSVVKEPPACIHGVFVVPKDDGGGRAVVDCSQPPDRSVNNYTASVSCKFSYNGVEDVVDVIEIGDHLASIDIKDAYRAVPIHPVDRSKQGIKWEFSGDDGRVTYMVDNRLCMGLSSSPYIFSKLSDFVVRCAVREGVTRMINYLDDFCIVGGSYRDTKEALYRVVAILRRLGFYISFRKLRSPSTKLRFLGIDINAATLQLTLPEDKLERLRAVLKHFRGRKKASRKDLERLGGLLAHCAKVVRGGRTFCRRIYDMMAPLRKANFRIRLSKGFRADVDWWHEFAGRFNGISGMIGKFSPTVAVYSDASNWGCGATHLDDWLVGSFVKGDDGGLAEYAGHHHAPPPGWVGAAHINIKEMWAVSAGAQRWASRWRDSSIIFITDSAVVQGSLNSGRSSSPEIMELLRRLFWLSVEFNFIFVSTYISTDVNITCDALSRLDKKSSGGRIRRVDGCGRMCCASIFDVPFLVSSRGSGTGGGAEGI